MKKVIFKISVAIASIIILNIPMLTFAKNSNTSSPLITTVPASQNQTRAISSPGDINGTSQSSVNNIPMTASAPVIQNTANTDTTNQSATPASSGTAGASGGTQLPGASGQQTPTVTTFTLQNPLNPGISTVGGFLQNAVTIFTYLVILFAVLAFIWVGFQYILARGNASKMQELSSWLLMIVIGVAIVIGARLMIQIVINTLSATGVVNSKVIQSAQNAAQLK